MDVAPCQCLAAPEYHMLTRAAVIRLPLEAGEFDTPMPGRNNRPKALMSTSYPPVLPPVSALVRPRHRKSRIAQAAVMIIADAFRQASAFGR